MSAGGRTEPGAAVPRPAPPPDSSQLTPITFRLGRIVAELAGARDLDTVTEVVTSHAAGALGATVASLSLVRGDELELAGIRGALAGTAERWASHPIAAPVPAGEAVRSRRPVLVVGNAEIEQRFPALAGELPEERSLAVVPVLAGDRAFGAIALIFSGHRRLDEREMGFLVTLADACAQALARLEAIAESTEAATKLSFLAEASAELASSLDYGTTLANVARLAVPTLADWCTVDVLEDGGLQTLALAHVDPEKVSLAWELRNRYPTDPDAPSGAPNVIRTGQSEWAAEISDEMLEAAAVDAEHLRLLRDLQLCSGLTVPLTARGRVLGALTLISAESRRRYTEADVAFAEDLARRAGLAIDNAKLHRQSEQTALRLQRAILPERPSARGWDVAVHYSPAGDTDVGGDFFDVVELDFGRTAVIVGDVAGRGVAAAAAMAQVRAAVRAYLALDPDPSAVLERLDRFFTRFELAQLVTLAYLVLDTQADVVEIGNAGHLPPLIVDGVGGATLLPEAQSPPIGTGPHERASTTVPFPPGTTLLVYTDGLVERRGEDIDAGIERLVVTAKAIATGPLEDGLLGVIDALAGSDRDDDVTAVAIRRCPG